MPEADLSTLLAFFKAMANESRLRIVGLIAERERSGQELAAILGLKEPTVSHHLAALRALDLVSVRAEGVTHWYALRVDRLTEFNKALFETKAATAMPGDETAWEDKVIANFVGPDGVLNQIPASRRKRWVILKWLMAGFKGGERYPEPQVNAILQRRHPDSATLRRELVGAGMLAREGGVYWRLLEAEWKAFDER